MNSVDNNLSKIIYTVITEFVIITIILITENNQNDTKLKSKTAEYYFNEILWGK